MSLPPVQPPFGRPQHIDPHAEVRLILKEKVMSLTGDAFDITMDPGNGQPPRPIFKVDPSLLTSKKAFFDMQGNHQFDMKKEHFHLVHQYMKLVDAEGNKFCEVKKNFTSKPFLFSAPSHGVPTGFPRGTYLGGLRGDGHTQALLTIYKYQSASAPSSQSPSPRPAEPAGTRSS